MSSPDAQFSTEDEAGIRRFVRGLNVIVGLAVLLAAVGVVLAPQYSTSRLVVMCIGFSTVAASEWQLRQSAQRAVLTLAFGFWILTALNAALLAGVHSSGNIVFPFVIALVGWALGTRWLIAVTALTVVYLSTLGLLEYSGLFVPTMRPGVLTVTTTLLSLIPVMGYLTYAAKKQLTESRNRALGLSHDVSLLLDNVPAGVAAFDAESRLRNCNQRYADLFGCKVNEIVGKIIAEYVPPLAMEQVSVAWDKASQGTMQTYRRFNVHPVTAAVTWLDVTVTPEVLDGRVIGLYAILIDVTEKVAAEAEIHNLNSELEARVKRRTDELARTMQELQTSREELVRSQAKASLSALVASVSHELSTPIGNSVLVASTLRESSQRLQQQLQDNQLKKSTLHEHSTSLAEGSQLLLNNLARAETLLKNFKQVSADQASEQRRTFDLAEVIDEVVTSLSPSLRKQPYVVQQDIARGIMFDSLPGPLGQVAINLINNAYMHAFEGRQTGKLIISAQDLGAEVVLRFKDDGVGIAPEMLPNLFEPFFSTKIGRGGTGLGMSIVESIVRKSLGGAMRVQSVRGEGTEFEVQLPKRAPLPANA